MSQDPKDDAKQPHAQDYVLHALYRVSDALKRESFTEAIQHTTDAVAVVQNEIDWCYRTDAILPYVLEFLINLTHTIATVEKVIPSLRGEQVAAIIKELKEIPEEQAHITAKLTKQQAPGTCIDLLEKEHRARTYGLNLYDKEHEENWRKR